MSQFDVTIIGSGPGGYVAAIRAAQLGFKTAIIEKYPTLGGTCLNVGCIPSKALLDSSEHFEKAKHEFANLGILINEPKVDLPRMIARKNEVVETTTKGINYLMDKNKVTVFQGVGSFESATKVKITKNDGSTETIESKYIIIATGSKPSSLPFINIDKERIITSTEALNLQKVPKKLLVIGGGVIGLELGSVYLRLGAEVTIIEYLDKIIPGMDGSLSKELQKVLKKQGMKFELSTAVSAVERNGDSVKITATNKKGEVSFEGDYCLVSVGRRPYTDGLGLENAGVELDERGRVKVNDHLQTNVSNIYAIGDVTGNPQFTYISLDDFRIIRDNLYNGGNRTVNDRNVIPYSVFINPPLSRVGMTESEAIAKGYEVKTGRLEAMAIPKAKIEGVTDGLLKAVVDAKTDKILGCTLLCNTSHEMINIVAAAMKAEQKYTFLKDMIFTHPTMSEALNDLFGSVK